MPRLAPLTVAAGLFAAIALPLRAGSAGEPSQDVDAWFGQHQSSLTVALDEKLKVAAELEKHLSAATTKGTATLPATRNSGTPVKHIAAASAI